MPEGKEEELDSDILALKFSWNSWWGCCVVLAGFSGLGGVTLRGLAVCVV